MARRIGEPSVLDEDLAVAYLRQAGIGPERTLGIARHSTIDPYGESETTSYLIARVDGVHVFHAGAGGGAAPLAIAPGPPDGVRIELLNWDTIARAVHPVRQHRPHLPSPFPYLPLTPQELLRAYLEIVGAAVRMHGGAHVVLCYRDSPAYAEGRQRWAAYESDVLQADLSHGTRPRRPLPEGTYRMGGVERAANRVADAISIFDPDTSNYDNFDPPRYCWPPVQG